MSHDNLLIFIRSEISLTIYLCLGFRLHYKRYCLIILKSPFYIIIGFAIDHYLSTKSLLPSQVLINCLIVSWSVVSISCLLVELATGNNMVVPPKSETNLADVVNQKAHRRWRIFLKKVSEYSLEYGADIHIVIYIKKFGKIFILTSNSKG